MEEETIVWLVDDTAFKDDNSELLQVATYGIFSTEENAAEAIRKIANQEKWWNGDYKQDRPTWISYRRKDMGIKGWLRARSLTVDCMALIDEVAKRRKEINEND